MRRIAVEAWAPEYGAPMAAELEPSAAAVDLGVELPPHAWAPLRSTGARAARVRFVDGVRRVDARVWIEGEDGVTRQGVAASFAAGVVGCRPGAAAVETCAVRRVLYCADASAPGLVTRHGTYQGREVAGESADELVGAVQEGMLALEAKVAAQLGAPERDGDLVVVDGPLRETPPVPGGVGYVKTHQRSYLPPPQAAVVAALAPGERTPLFRTTTSWSRYSWYLRLPGGAGHAWAGVVRGEARGDLDPSEARRLADLAAATLPAYASTPAKDPRAPQNLHPIADLERRLRHHLGDAAVLTRALSVAAARLPVPIASGRAG